MRGVWENACHEVGLTETAIWAKNDGNPSITARVEVERTPMGTFDPLRTIGPPEICHSEMRKQALACGA